MSDIRNKIKSCTNMAELKKLDLGKEFFNPFLDNYFNFAYTEYGEFCEIIEIKGWCTYYTYLNKDEIVLKFKRQHSIFALETLFYILTESNYFNNTITEVYLQDNSDNLLTKDPVCLKLILEEESLLDCFLKIFDNPNENIINIKIFYNDTEKMKLGMSFYIWTWDRYSLCEEGLEEVVADRKKKIEECGAVLNKK